MYWLQDIFSFSLFLINPEKYRNKIYGIGYVYFASWYYTAYGFSIATSPKLKQIYKTLLWEFFCTYSFYFLHPFCAISVIKTTTLLFDQSSHHRVYCRLAPNLLRWYQHQSVIRKGLCVQFLRLPKDG